MSKIKLHISRLISIVLITVVLLPFAVQFSHAFEKHKHLVCEAQNITHFDTHEVDCSVFHFKINTNTVEFIATEYIAQNILIEEKRTSFKSITATANINYKSLRAPPYFIVS